MRRIEVQKPQSGQALIEFIITLGPLLFCLIGCGLLSADQWNRVKCAYQVFEAAHHRLEERSVISSHVEIFEDEQTVGARARCNYAREEVRLFRLEAGNW